MKTKNNIGGVQKFEFCQKKTYFMEKCLVLGVYANPDSVHLVSGISDYYQCLVFSSDWSGMTMNAMWDLETSKSFWQTPVLQFCGKQF